MGLPHITYTMFINFNNVFTETEVLDKQECYLLEDLNINLILDEKKFSSTKVIYQITKIGRL